MTTKRFLFGLLIFAPAALHAQCTASASGSAIAAAEINARMCAAETFTAGTGGVTANTLVITDASNPAKAIAATGSGAYGIALATAAANASVAVARYGQIPCVMDNTATAGDLVIAGTSTVVDCRDSGQTSSASIPIATRIIGVLLTSASASSTAIVELSPAHFGTQTNSGGVARQCIFGSGGGSCLVTHNLGTATPQIGQAIVNSGCGTCYSIGTFTSNTFTVTSSQAANLTFAISYAAPLPPSYTLSVSSLSPSGVFASGGTATATVTMSPISSYTGTVTLSCSAFVTISGTCSFSPSTITTSGTSTITFTAPIGASQGTGSFIVGGTDGTLAESASATAMTVWAPPVQQWLMSEGASPMLDSSGNANNLVNTNATYTNIAGLLSNTLTFNGSTTASVASNFTNTNFNGSVPMSVCGWFMASNLGQQNGLVGTINSPAGWTLDLLSGGQFRTLLQDSTHATIQIVFNFTATVNVPFHACVTYTGSKAYSGFVGYINGAAVTQSTTTGSISASAAPGGAVTIGSEGIGYSMPLAGAAAGVDIFNYVLSAPQVAALYAGGAK